MAPGLRYYGGLIGAWSGAFSFEITDQVALRASPARWPASAMAFASRWLGPSTMSTTLSRGDGPRSFVHTTRVAKWGLVAFESREVITLDEAGAGLRMLGHQRSGLGGAREYDAPGEIDADGEHATYRVPWLGVEIVQRTAIQPDGALELVQETIFSRGRVLLRRR